MSTTVEKLYQEFARISQRYEGLETLNYAQRARMSKARNRLMRALAQVKVPGLAKTPRKTYTKEDIANYEYNRAQKRRPRQIKRITQILETHQSARVRYLLNVYLNPVAALPDFYIKQKNIKTYGQSAPDVDEYTHIIISDAFQALTDADVDYFIRNNPSFNYSPWSGSTDERITKLLQAASCFTSPPSLAATMLIKLPDIARVHNSQDETISKLRQEHALMLDKRKALYTEYRTHGFDIVRCRESKQVERWLKDNWTRMHKAAVRDQLAQ